MSGKFFSHDDQPVSNCLHIDLDAISANIRLLRDYLPQGTRLMIMTKALAYGTDDAVMAQFLERECDVDIFGVATVAEGVNLRKNGIQGAIFVMNAIPQEASWIAEYHLEVGVSEPTLIETLAREGKRVAVHLHINTGMSRFGCHPDAAVGLAQDIVNAPSLELAGVSTHFSSAEHKEEDPFTRSQAEAFDRVIEQLNAYAIQPKWRHAANSSGALRFSFSQYNMVRIGLAIYGLYASEDSQGALSLSLALALHSQIVGITQCTPGDSVGYSRKHRVEGKEQRIGVLPIGYFDGLHRRYGGKGEVLIQGKRVPIVGNVCMDFTMIDLTEVPEVQIGDPVILFGTDESGKTITPEALAKQGGTIPHELVTCLGPRIKRIFHQTQSRGYQHESSTKGLHPLTHVIEAYTCSTRNQRVVELGPRNLHASRQQSDPC